MTALPELRDSRLLEDVLRRVRLASAVFLMGDFAGPWAVTVNDPDQLAQYVAPNAKRLIVLHVAVEGTFRVTLPTSESALVAPGEGVVLPYCDVHTMGTPGMEQAVPVLTLLPLLPSPQLPIVARIDGTGSRTSIMCGYLHCDDMLFDPILRALPRLIHVRGGTDHAAQWRQASLRYTLERANQLGSDLSARIPEMVLVDCLRQYAAERGPEETGWLSALKDPIVGTAIALLHASPAEPWTVERLARELAVSRSLLAERFTHAVGEPPMRYLAHWRLQLAADLLRTTELSVGEIAARIGYDSEAAFSRAFKRRLAAAPATWREAQL